MGLIKKHQILEGAYWVEIPSIDLRLLCGCPPDSIKHLARSGCLTHVEKKGAKVELGPNAILLSDTPTQYDTLTSLSEFPLFHVFFTQGMMVPSHPNYGCPKPLLIGSEKQIKAQMDYVTMGNYGLITREQFIDVGETAEFAEKYLSMKRRFAMGDFLLTDDLVQPVFLDGESQLLDNGVAFKRVKQNIFEISYKGESVAVDLSIPDGYRYEPSFSLPEATIPDAYFSVTHTGEGDGWNPTKPGVSSVIQCNGEYYLVDAGPYITHILKSVGLSKEQISGIFVTHVHDDHFGGIYDFASLSKSGVKTKIFATNVVKATIVKKFAALLAITEIEVFELYEFIEIQKEVWNKVDGLSVKPIPTAHPVDTTILLFKAEKGGEERVYGHYCDIAALSWLSAMIEDIEKKDGITEDYYAEIKASFDIKTDLKKIDVGGPTIHGDASDFANDKTSRIVLSHTHNPFTENQLAVGTEVTFGDTDILID